MNQTSPTAVVRYGGAGFFIGVSPSGHAVTIDTGHERSTAPTPMELLLIALGSCTGVDVVSILEKKRQRVTDYRVEVTGERREEFPKRFEKMHIRHIVTGVQLDPTAIARAIELSEEKYCSVAATLRPTVEIISSFEIIEIGTADTTADTMVT
jgi:putative redox protein